MGKGKEGNSTQIIIFLVSGRTEPGRENQLPIDPKYNTHLYVQLSSVGKSCHPGGGTRTRGVAVAFHNSQDCTKQKTIRYISLSVP